MKILLLLLIVINLFAKEYNLSNLDKDFVTQWKYILHLNNKNFAKFNKNFYLSYPYVNFYNEFILNLNEIKNNNKNFICNFPYRYLFLKKYYKLPNYNLGKCKKLQNFIKNFSKQKLGIVFSAEYSSSPQSSFGHVMLIFKNKNSLLNSDVIHFAAKANHKDGFLKYSYNGLSGNYPAFYIREKFFKKHYLYNIIQQRTMYIYWLNFNKNDIKNLIYHIYELRKFKAKYYFLKVNCSSALIDLIKIIDPDPHINSNNKILPFLPIDSIKLLKNKIVRTQVLYPLEIQIILLEKKLSNKERNIFYNIVTLQKVDYNLKDRSDTFKELLYKYYRYKFTKYHFVYPNYNIIEKLNFKSTKINYSNINKDPLHKTQPSEINLKYMNHNKFILSFRPFLIDIKDNQKNILNRKIYKIFTPEFLVNNSNIKLNKLDIYNIKSLNVNYTPYLKPFSWGINIDLNRENKRNILCFNTEINYGYTYNIIGNTVFSFLGGIGIDTRKSYNNFYLKPEIYLLKNFNKSSFTVHMYYKTFENYKNLDISYNLYIKNITISVGRMIKSRDKNNYINFSFNF
jgi:hypothetical protein